MILVTGAAGKTGQAVMRALAARGAAVRAWVRRTDQAATLMALGARETVSGDLTDAAAWSPALHGCRAVYHLAPNVHPAEIDIARHLLAAAQSQPDLHIVYHSVLHPHIEAMPHHWAKLRVEELLLNSNHPVTILQPGAYMQNVSGMLSTIRDTGAYTVPYSLDATLSLVDLNDVAAVAAQVLTEPNHADAIYELAGPQPLSARDIAAGLTAALGLHIVANQTTVADWSANAAASGLPKHAIATLSAMFRYYDQHGLRGNPTVLTALLGRPPTTFDRFLSMHVN